jgi:hypothetical protein
MSFQKLYYKYLNFFINILSENDVYCKVCALFVICVPYVVLIYFIPCVQLNFSHFNTLKIWIVFGSFLSVILSSVSFYGALPFHLMALPLEMYTQSCYSILFAPQIFFSTFWILFPPINNYRLLQSFKHKTNKMWVLPYSYQKQIRKQQSWNKKLCKFILIFYIGSIYNIFFLPFLCPHCPGECF